MDSELVRGDLGEFTVWVDGEKVASKGLILFPSEAKIVKAVKKALSKSGSKA